MLTQTTVIVPARYSFALLSAATRFGVEVEQGDGNYADLIGKVEKVEAVLNSVPVLPVDAITSVPGDHEGFGTSSDLVNGKDVYAGLVGRPRFE